MVVRHTRPTPSATPSSGESQQDHSISVIVLFICLSFNTLFHSDHLKRISSKPVPVREKTQNISIVNKSFPVFFRSRDRANMVTYHRDTHTLRQLRRRSFANGNNPAVLPILQKSFYSEKLLCNHVSAFVEVRAPPSTGNFLRRGIELFFFFFFSLLQGLVS